MRFFAKRTSGTVLSTLTVEVLFEGLGGLVRGLPIGVVVGGNQWQPTLPFPVVANLLPLLPGRMTPVAFRFTRSRWHLAGRRRLRRSLEGALTLTRQAVAGTCCVMQWTPPPPSASTSPPTATASRPG